MSNRTSGLAQLCVALAVHGAGSNAYAQGLFRQESRGLTFDAVSSTPVRVRPNAYVPPAIPNQELWVRGVTAGDDIGPIEMTSGNSMLGEMTAQLNRSQWPEAGAFTSVYARLDGGNYVSTLGGVAGLDLRVRSWYEMEFEVVVASPYELQTSSYLIAWPGATDSSSQSATLAMTLSRLTPFGTEAVFAAQTDYSGFDWHADNRLSSGVLAAGIYTLRLSLDMTMTQLSSAALPESWSLYHQGAQSVWLVIPGPGVVALVVPAALVLAVTRRRGRV